MSVVTIALFTESMVELWRVELLQSSISSVRTVWPCWVIPTGFKVRILLYVLRN